MTDLCYRCGAPATGSINMAVNMASSVPSFFKPVCDEHNPYRLGDMTRVSKTTRQAELAEVDRLRQENAMLRQVLSMTDPCIHQEVDNARQAHADGRTITLEQYMADTAALDQATTPPEATDRPLKAMMREAEQQGLYDRPELALDSDPKLTKEEFAERYAQQSGVTVEWLTQHGRVVEPCDCGQPDCRGWQMAYVCDHPEAERSGLGDSQ